MKHTVTIALLVLFASFRSAAQGPVDIGVADAGPMDYVLPGTHQFQIGGKLLSGVLSDANDFRVGYSFNNGPWQVQSATIDYTRSVPDCRFLLSVPVTPTFSVSAPGQYQMKIFLKCPTINDPNAANDTMVRIVRVYKQLPPKNVVFEMLKWQNCTPCYACDTAVESQIVPSPYTSVAKLFMAPGEPLYQKDAFIVDSTLLGMHGHPAFMYDRFRWPYNTDATVVYNAVRIYNPANILIDDTGYRVQYLEPVAVSFDAVSYDSVTRRLKVKLKATIYDTLTGAYRFNLHLTEDSLLTFQSGAPNYYQHMHNHVLRAMIGGAWGMAGTLPSPLLPGKTYTYEFQYQIPSTYKVKQLRLIGLMQRYDAADIYNRRILNSCSAPLLKSVNITTGVANTAIQSVPLTLSPNPVADRLRFSWSCSASLRMQLVSTSGQLLREWFDEGKDISAPAGDLPAGSYILRVTDGNTVASAQFIKL